MHLKRIVAAAVGAAMLAALPSVPAVAAPTTKQVPAGWVTPKAQVKNGANPRAGSRSAVTRPKLSQVARNRNAKVRYQWTLNGNPIKGQTRQFLPVRRHHLGKILRVRVRVTAPGFTQRVHVVDLGRVVGANEPDPTKELPSSNDPTWDGIYLYRGVDTNFDSHTLCEACIDIVVRDGIAYLTQLSGKVNFAFDTYRGEIERGTTILYAAQEVRPFGGLANGRGYLWARSSAYTWDIVYDDGQRRDGLNFFNYSDVEGNIEFKGGKFVGKFTVHASWNDKPFVFDLDDYEFVGNGL